MDSWLPHFKGSENGGGVVLGPFSWAGAQIPAVCKVLPCHLGSIPGGPASRKGKEGKLGWREFLLRGRTLNSKGR